MIPSLRADSYHARWLEQGINCETCHGPGRGHLRLIQELQREKRDRPPQELKIMGSRNDYAAARIQTGAVLSRFPTSPMDAVTRGPWKAP